MIRRMDAQWFKNRLKALEKSQNQLADKLGVAPPRITEMLKSERRVAIAEAIEMALFLKVPTSEIFRRLGYASIGGIPVPVISWVSAGALVMPDSNIDLDDCPLIDVCGLDETGDWIALRVVGDSMDRISPPDSVIIINRKDKRLVANACYVIADIEGKATYKRYRPSPKRFEPVSTNPDHEPIFPHRDPSVIGRVRMTLLKM